MAYDIDKPPTRRVQVGGSFPDEWFEVLLYPSMTALVPLMSLRGASSEGEALSGSLPGLTEMLVDWSIVSAGQKAPITVENMKRLPAEMQIALILAIKDLNVDFLARG